MNAINNYAAFYKMSGTANLVSTMLGGSSGGTSGVGQIGDLAAANDAKLAIIMGAQSGSSSNEKVTNSQNYAKYREEAATFSKKLDSVVDNLKSSSQKLQDYTTSSVLNPKGYGSKNGDVASVTSDLTSSSASNEAIALNVSQTAKAQDTQSAAFSSKDKNLGGSSSITLYNADKSKSTKLSFNFSYSTTNKDALTQMASKINDSKMGVTASVIEKDGKSSLSIVSNKTGTDSAFTATVSGSASSKLNFATTEAQNAIYTENGFRQNSQSNEIKLADGKVSATIKGVGSTSIEKNVRDNSAIVDATKKFASDYNDALDLFSKYSNRSPAMNSMASAFSSSKYSSNKLSEIGINVSANGKLSVDATKLSSALEKTPEKVTNILSGKDGLANTAYQKASAAKINERTLFPPASQAQNAFSPAAYNKNLNFVTSYLSGTFLNSMI